MGGALKRYRFEPDYAIPPGETLQEVMKSLGMSQKGLADTHRAGEHTQRTGGGEHIGDVADFDQPGRYGHPVAEGADIVVGTQAAVHVTRVAVQVDDVFERRGASGLTGEA